MSPTQRTLKKLKEDGYKAGIVERFAPPVRGRPHGIRMDLFGIIDIIAIKDGQILGVQSTGTAFSEHCKKLTIEKVNESLAWIEAGGELELWGWRKVKVKRGGRAMKWEPRIKKVKFVDLILL
ncbi:MAG: hypothetical protein VW907_03705 [Opitutae bacterium]